MKGMSGMDEKKYKEELDKFMSLSKEDFDKIFSQLSLIQIDEFLNLIDEVNE